MADWGPTNILWLPCSETKSIFKIILYILDFGWKNCRIRTGKWWSSVCLWSLQGAIAQLCCWLFCGSSGSWAILIARLGHKSWVTDWVERLIKNGFIFICTVKYKKRTFQGHRSHFLIPDWWRVITIWDSWQSSPSGKYQIFAEAKQTPWHCFILGI